MCLSKHLEFCSVLALCLPGLLASCWEGTLGPLWGYRDVYVQSVWRGRSAVKGYTESQPCLHHAAKKGISVLTGFQYIVQCSIPRPIRKTYMSRAFCGIQFAWVRILATRSIRWISSMLYPRFSCAAQYSLIPINWNRTENLLGRYCRHRSSWLILFSHSQQRNTRRPVSDVVYYVWYIAALMEYIRLP